MELFLIMNLLGDIYESFLIKVIGKIVMRNELYLVNVFLNMDWR